MSRIHLRTSNKTLTSHAGLDLIGDCLNLAHIDLSVRLRTNTRRLIISIESPYSNII